MPPKDKEKALTIKDVAKAAGVSITTVSRVLNNNFDLVNSQTRERVQATIKDMGFTPNAMAQGLHFDNTKTIGLIIQDIANPYYPSIVREVENTAQRLGYSVFLANAQRSEKRIVQYLEIMRGKRVDGLILVGGGIVKNAEKQNFFDNSKMKVIVIGKPSSASLPSVQIENVAAAKMACEYLLSMGHTRIAMLSGPENSTTALDRTQGYFEALQARKISHHPEWVMCGNFDYGDAFRATESLIGDNNEHQITAIFAHNDLMAIGAMNALRKKGFRIPEDISVLGFDNIPAASFVTPSLTTVSVPVDKMGQIAMENLARLLERKKIQQSILLPVGIELRKSVAIPPN